MPFLELFDETLDINSTENYELSVQLSTSDLSFCILDTLRNKFVLLRSYEPDDKKEFEIIGLKDILNTDDFLSKHYKKVLISHSFSKIDACSCLRCLTSQKGMSILNIIRSTQ